MPEGTSLRKELGFLEGQRYRCVERQLPAFLPLDLEGDVADLNAQPIGSRCGVIDEPCLTGADFLAQRL